MADHGRQTARLNAVSAENYTEWLSRRRKARALVAAEEARRRQTPRNTTHIVHGLDPRDFGGGVLTRYSGQVHAVR
jgi:hypothetical protein